MSYQLINQNDPDRFIFMNNWTWYAILELAEKHGWNPIGTVTPERLELAGIYPGNESHLPGDYWGYEPRLVLFEDALNMAEALDVAFLRYEPVRLPSLHPFFLSSGNGDNGHQPPGIGVIQIMIRFCQEGSFLIERF